MTDASSKPSKPRRRWFQFSLRTLVIVVTLVAGLLLAWRVYVEPYRRQREGDQYRPLLFGHVLQPRNQFLGFPPGAVDRVSHGFLEHRKHDSSHGLP